MSEKKEISGYLRMAKADQADLETAYRVMRLLNDMSSGYYPSTEEGAPTFFDSDDWEHLQFLHQQVIEIAENSGGVSRVIGAASILLNPKNNLIDPDGDCIELHPDMKAENAASEEAEKLRARVAELESECERCAKVKGQLLAALKTAEAGLVWYQGMHPEHVDGSDDEAMDEIAKAIADAEQLELPLQPPRVGSHDSPNKTTEN